MLINILIIISANILIRHVRSVRYISECKTYLYYVAWCTQLEPEAVQRIDSFKIRPFHVHVCKILILDENDEFLIDQKGTEIEMSLDPFLVNRSES